MRISGYVGELEVKSVEEESVEEEFVEEESVEEEAADVNTLLSLLPHILF